MSATTAAAAALALAELRAAARDQSAPLRDPRVTQLDGERTITIPETCGFYGVQTAIPTCRVPRSCQDCLLMPDCLLTGDGQCVSVHEPEGKTQYLIDYHLALPLYPLGNAYNRSLLPSDRRTSFFATNATYCDATDPVCSQCRKELAFFAESDDTVDWLQTQFCVGTGGCVCVAICEAPRARVSRVYDSKCDQPKPRAVASAALNRRNTTMTRWDPRSPPQDFLDRKQSVESCEYYRGKHLKGCRRPRTCQDCLMQPSCVLADFKCTSMSHYNPAMDFRSDRYREGDDHFKSMPTAMFPSTNTTYCPSSDDYCRAQFMDPIRQDTPWKSVVESSTFGVGRDGCVCIQACESGQWSTGVYDTECTNLGGVGKKTDPRVHVATGAITVIVWIVLLLLYKRSKGELVAPSRRAMERAGVRILRHMLDEVPVLGRLDLFGWRRFQERLAFKEQQLLRGEEVVSPVQHPVAFDVAASAPDFDEDDSSAPMAHDARAFATAPMYRASIGDSDGETSDPWAPSAPDFDLDNR